MSSVPYFSASLLFFASFLPVRPVRPWCRRPTLPIAFTHPPPSEGGHWTWAATATMQDRAVGQYRRCPSPPPLLLPTGRPTPAPPLSTAHSFPPPLPSTPHPPPSPHVPTALSAPSTPSTRSTPATAAIAATSANYKCLRQPPPSRPPVRAPKCLRRSRAAIAASRKATTIKVSSLPTALSRERQVVTPAVTRPVPKAARLRLSGTRLRRLRSRRRP